jgi:uncharacterized lipoprotein YehR (DUF1307 family)
MKLRKSLYCIVIIGLFIALSACGNSDKKADTSSEEETTELVTTEEVTEFSKEKKSISFSDVESGINFKADGTEVIFSFENIKEFDNSLGMEFCLTDTAYEEDPITIAISKNQVSYTFSGLTEGKEYYLEVYPTKSASSDSEYDKIEEQNSKCKLTLEQ